MGPSVRRGARSRAVLLLAVCALLASVAAPGVAAADPRAGRNGERVKVIVTFRSSSATVATDAIEAAGGTIRYRYSIIPAVSAEVPRKALDGLRHNPRVVSVEHDGQLTALDHIGNDTGDLEYENAWGVEHIGTKPVHDAGIRGQGVKVAVIDTGIDYIHNQPPANEPPVVDPEFNSNYMGGYDFFNNDPDPMDDNGHGTHVAGILAAEHNGYLVVGVAPAVDLYALKVLGATGSGDYSGLIAALDWAVQNDMDVVNMSLGGHEASAALQSAIQAAYGAGITLVAASGNVVTINELIYGCPVAYPAAYNEVIAVSFTNSADKLTGYSCTGTQVDLGAPGDQIFSPVPVGSCMFCSSLGYRAESGTSMASPHVAGVAALILSAGIANAGDPATLADDVKAHLCETASVASYPPISDPRYPKWYGCGIVDALQALIVDPPDPPAGANHNPVAADDAATTAEDSPVDVAVLANDTDVDGDTLTVASAGGASLGAVTVNPDGTIHYAPGPDANGTDTFSYTINDGAGGSDTGTVTVGISAVNDAPIAADDALVTAKNIASTIDVLANDGDVDGDTLSTTGVTTPAHGGAAIQPNGSVTYTPNAGFAGSDGFDYTVSDGAGGTDTGHVAVTVTATNSPPVAVPDAVTTAEDTAAGVAVLANDLDEDGGALVTTAVTQPAHGTAAIQDGGTVLYTPAPNYNGPDSFGYTVADGAGATGSGTVTVTVTPVNDAPIAVPDSISTAEDTPASVVLHANDTDVDGDVLTTLSVSQPVLGTALIEADGSVTYTPNPNFAGSDSFTYVVTDGAGGTASATVSVTVSPVNDPPTATPRTVSTAYQTAVSINLYGNDEETCELQFQIVSLPAHGTLGTPSSITCAFILAPYTDYSKVKYTPAAGYSGADQFTYRTSDGSGWSAPATVDVTVTPPVELHVGDLDGSKTIQTTSWTAKVTIRVENASNAAVSGVTVTGMWTNGASGPVTCKTGSAGTCTVSKSSIPKTTTSVTFTVTGLTLTSGIYVPAANHDPDGDSTGTVIVVNGP